MNDSEPMGSADVSQFEIVPLLPRLQASAGERAIFWLKPNRNHYSKRLSGLSKFVAPPIRLIKEGEIPEAFI